MTDSNSENPARVRIALDRALAPWLPEVTYTLDTLLEAAGYARDWAWADTDSDTAPDLYYGREPEMQAGIVIPWSGWAFEELAEREPCGTGATPEFAWPVFPGEADDAPALEDGRLRFGSDMVFAAFWALSGAREPRYPRDRVDNLSLAGSFVGDGGMRGTPWVSLLAARLRSQLEVLGLAAVLPEWGTSALAISHDVDYPEIVRFVELLRRPSDARAIFGEREPFWQFARWADFAETLGTRSAFYFMARQGSLVRYLAGDPDAFYDIGTPRYRTLLGELRERGCEIGLHASFRSSEFPERYAEEKHRVEEASGGGIVGNRQHYWRLDPDKPHESLAQLAEAGFAYDSSLGFERMPGFRRGTCHPFRPWHPEQRRALDLIEVPPAWMDDHYDGRLVDHGIEVPEDHARTLLDDVGKCGGVAVVDYHVRGMNEQFFPRWGRWLSGFLPDARPAGMAGRTPAEIAEAWQDHTQHLAAASRSLATVPS